MKIYYGDHANFPLPLNHRFPVEKYRLLRLELLRQGFVQSEDLVPSQMVSGNIIKLAHTSDYYDSFIHGKLTDKQIRRIGLPWSQELVRRAHVSIGGVVQASEEALKSGVAGCLSGGTHHASAAEGKGYCIFNDCAVAARFLFKENIVRRVAIIDLDVHQGDGNSAILGEDERVFIFSMHCQNIFPVHKIPSTLDIGLEDGLEDEIYLKLLAEALPRIFDFRPNIIFYNSGVDPLKEDRLGKLNLTMEGLMERDRMVLGTCQLHKIPITITMGGGYAQPIELTVKAHAQTYRVAKEVYG